MLKKIQYQENPCNVCKRPCPGRFHCFDFMKAVKGRQTKSDNENKISEKEILYSLPKEVTIPPNILPILNGLGLLPAPAGRFSIDIRRGKEKGKIEVITRLNGSKPRKYSISGKNLKKPFKLIFVDSKPRKVN